MTESNIEVPNEQACAFCDYLAGRRPYTVAFRSGLVAVLVTREQRGVGHVLVIPVRHCPTLLDATAEERHALIDAVAEMSRTIDAAFERPGIAVWQNNGVPAHQMIPHLHFHVAGTLPSGGTEFGDVQELTVEQTDVIADKIRRAMPEPSG